MSGWTEDRVERMRALWAEGASCSQIARHLGGVSRNAVIGKLHRLGLANDASRPRSRGGVATTPRAAIPPKPKVLSKSEVAERLARDLPQTDDPFSPRGCRWPIGEVGATDFRFCQRPRTKRRNGLESAWCEAHHAMGHQCAA